MFFPRLTSFILRVSLRFRLLPCPHSVTFSTLQPSILFLMNMRRKFTRYYRVKIHEQSDTYHRFHALSSTSCSLSQLYAALVVVATFVVVVAGLVVVVGATVVVGAVVVGLTVVVGTSVVVFCSCRPARWSYSSHLGI